MKKNRITLAAVGDISFARTPEEVFHQNSPDYLFEEVRNDLAAADLRFANFESVLIPPDFPIERCSGSPLKSYDTVLPAVKPLNFDILHIASNHILDCGWRGLLHTYNSLRDLGAQTLGAGPDQEEARALRVVEIQGTRIGFLGYLQSGDWTLEGGGGRVAYWNLDNITADILRHRAAADILVVSLHGDIEFQPGPSLPRRDFCRQIAEAGADLILCHHPHVPQGVEWWGKTLIHYSLGNFLFDITGYQLNSSPEVNRSHMFLVEIENGRIVGWRRKYYRLHPDEGGRPRPVPEAELEAEDQYYKDLDKLLTQPDRMRKLWHDHALWRLSWMMKGYAADAELDPFEFLKRHSRIFFSEMSHEYLKGIQDIARREYLKNAYADHEYKRPYAPYENG